MNNEHTQDIRWQQRFENYERAFLRLENANKEKRAFNDMEKTAIKIFGSRAKGNYRNNSDIDLVIWGPISPREVESLRMDLDELPTPYEFDLINYENLDHENLKSHIDRIAKVFTPHD